MEIYIETVQNFIMKSFRQQGNSRPPETLVIKIKTVSLITCPEGLGIQTCYVCHPENLDDEKSFGSCVIRTPCRSNTTGLLLMKASGEWNFVTWCLDGELINYIFVFNEIGIIDDG